MSTEENKAIVGRWFTEFWGQDFNPAVIDELAAPGIRFEYSQHAPCRGRDEVRQFAARFRAAFPDLSLWGTADLIAEGDYVVGQWEGGGTHTGDAFGDMPVGSLPAGLTGPAAGPPAPGWAARLASGLRSPETGVDPCERSWPPWPPAWSPCWRRALPLPHRRPGRRRARRSNCPRPRPARSASPRRAGTCSPTSPAIRASRPSRRCG